MINYYGAVFFFTCGCETRSSFWIWIVFVFCNIFVTSFPLKFELQLSPGRAWQRHESCEWDGGRVGILGVIRSIVRCEHSLWNMRLTSLHHHHHHHHHHQGLVFLFLSFLIIFLWYFMMFYTFGMGLCDLRLSPLNNLWHKPRMITMGRLIQGFISLFLLPPFIKRLTTRPTDVSSFYLTAFVVSRFLPNRGRQAWRSMFWHKNPRCFAP
jgi:hypothetical protein